MDKIVNYAGFGRRIRKCRKDHRMTQEELAERVGISISHLGHIERGTRKASIETLVRIARSLNISVDELLKDSLGVTDKTYTIPEPENYIESIRNLLNRMEKEYYSNRLT